MNWSCSNVQYALLNEYNLRKKDKLTQNGFYCTQTMMVKAEKKDKKKKESQFQTY